MMNLAIRRVALLLALGLPTQFGIAAESIYDALIQQGVELSADETTKLPPPVLPDGLDAAAQRQAIESALAGRYEWDQFTRKSVVSPLLLKIDDPDRESGQVSRRVDLYFVAYGELDVFGNDRKLQEQLNLASSGDVDSAASQVTVLSPDQLAKRGLSTSSPNAAQRWVAVEATLLNKVQLALTTRNEKLQTDDSLVVASRLDPKFQNDAEYPNCWRAITFDDAGRRQIGPPQPYIGLGSYVKATRLTEPAGAVFIEYHVAYAEPHGWFRGANLLRSKLPIVAQDLVRKLRRKMAEQ
jgi:hypothetical protein